MRGGKGYVWEVSKKEKEGFSKMRMKGVENGRGIGEKRGMVA